MLRTIKSVYIIGVGGISLSALALILKSRGITVYGSDITSSNMTDKLIREGIIFKEGEAPEFVRQAEAVIYTSAVGENNGDLALARALNKPIFSRAEVLGELSRESKAISVAGTHGKTTTTGMIATVLLGAGLDPTVHIGGILNEIDSNLHIGEGEYLVTEACEYKDSFLQLKNHIAIVLNVHEDHLDYFKNIDNIYHSFNKFIENTDKNGVIVYNCDDFNENLIISRPSLSFGIDGGDVQAVNIKEYCDGRYSFDVMAGGEVLCNIKLPCFGRHNIYNALATIATCLFLDVSVHDIKEGIERFGGVKRRFELIKEENDHLIIHDYAHHPQEIKATLKACREIKKDGKIVAIFQPHTFTRTRDLFDDFVRCFNLCDEVWLLPIYPAREEPIEGITSLKLSEEIEKNGKKCRYFDDFECCEREIIKNFSNIDLIAILGAGDIEKLAYELRNRN